MDRKVKTWLAVDEMELEIQKMRLDYMALRNELFESSRQPAALHPFQKALAKVREANDAINYAREKIRP